MSNYQSPIDKIKFTSEISLTAVSPFILSRKNVDESEVALSISASNSFFKQLNETVHEYSLSFVTILNTQINNLQLADTERLNSRLKSLSTKILSEIKRVKGGQRQNYLLKQRSITIFKTELVNVREQTCTIKNLDEDKIRFEKKCYELYEKLKLEEEKITLISEQNLDIFTLQQKNYHLVQKIKELEDRLPQTNQSEKELDTLKTRTYFRTIKRLESEAKKALWFCETYGLSLNTLNLKSDQGKNITLEFGKANEKSDFSSVPEDEKEKIRTLVFLMDRFCISDAAYHELAMHEKQLPRSYLLVQRRNDINKHFEIQRLPGNVPGAFIDIESEINSLLEHHIELNPDSDFVKIKFSGDGTKVSRISNFVIFSLSDVSSVNSVSFQDQRTFAIVECSEKYESLKICCCPIFDQINNILSKKKWIVSGKEIEVDYFVSADMKFIQILLGLGSSTGEYACPWCKVKKTDRSNMSFPWDFYHREENARSVDSMKDLSKNNRREFGCQNRPLLDLQIDHYLPDELHLMLRITDVLLRNLIYDAKSLDSNAKVNRLPQIHLKGLVKIIQDCGISFAIWDNKAGEMEWTSLSGSDKIKLLKCLPQVLLTADGIINVDTRDDVVDLWREFYLLYKYVNETTDKAPIIFEKCKLWILDFLNIGQKLREGYHSHNITPYMHCLAYHLPYFCEHFGPLKSFSGQGVEKNNDIVKQIHQKKSNKWDSAVSALTTRKRLEFGQFNKLEREKRSYDKQSEWWDAPIRASRSAKRKEIRDEIESAADTGTDFTKKFDEKTDQELRQYLKSNGINTKVRNRQKLLQMISSL